MCFLGRKVQLHPAHHLRRINSVVLRSRKTHSALLSITDVVPKLGGGGAQWTYIGAWLKYQHVNML